MAEGGGTKPPYYYREEWMKWMKEEMERMKLDERFLPKPLTERKITLVRGSIQFEEVDVIACAVDNTLNLAVSGTAARYLLTSGGRSLQRECNERFPSGIKCGEVIAINGGDLKCKQVYLSSLPDNEFEKNTGHKKVKTIISAMLNKAIKENVESIALPAIGTGKMGLTPHAVADIVYECIKGLPEIYLSEIRLVLNDNATYKVFQEKERKRQNDILPKYVHELIAALGKRTERRYGMRIVVMGHINGGKSTFINRMLRVAFNMSSINSTNGIVIISKGVIRIRDGQWLENVTGNDSENIKKRMAAAAVATKEVPNTKEDLEQVSTPFEDVNVPNAKQDLEEIRDVDAESEEICHLLIWDFAGRAVFNSCHQMFMSYRAVYLLVFDISRSLDSLIQDDDVFCLGFDRRMSLIEFTEFLLSSIHMYHGQEKDMFPKVLLIGTHRDQVDMGTAEKRMTKLKETIGKSSALKQHIAGDFIVDNTDSNDKEMTAVKQKLFEIGQKEHYWGEVRPSSWMPLEKNIIARRDSGTRILTLKEIRNINAENYIVLEAEKEVDAFLRFHNSLGNMMFFGGREDDDLVILDPQWLIDSLKQIITHSQFYQIPPGMDQHWKDFTESARLHKKLIEAVWSNNKDDTTFIRHKEKLLEILESTDIVSYPKVYNAQGLLQDENYFFVPSMLKPSQDQVHILEDEVSKFRKRSPTFCFVFEDNFLPPALFSRLLAACTKEYRIKSTSDTVLLFYQTGVFKLNKTHNLYLQKFKHTVRIIVFNTEQTEINLHICEAVLTFLEDNLLKLAQLYHETDNISNIPFYKAIQCPHAKEKLEALYPLADLEFSTMTMCMKHWPPWRWHFLRGKDLMQLWRVERTNYPLKQSAVVSVPPDLQDRILSPRDLGRLARGMSPKDLDSFASGIGLTKHEIDQLQSDHSGCVVDLFFAILNKWRTSLDTGSRSVTVFQETLREADIQVTEQEIATALGDKDYTKCFKDIPNSMLDIPLNDASVDMISQRSDRYYRQLAIELGIDPPQIEQIVKENATIVTRTRRFLKVWKEKNSTTATLRNIGKAIVEVGMDISVIYDCYDDNSDA